MRLSWKLATCGAVILLSQAAVSLVFGADNETTKPQSDPPKVATEPNKTAPNNEAPAVSGSSTAPNALPAGAQIKEQKFASWTLQCSSDKALKPPCQIVYRLASPDDKQVYMVISMARSADNKVGMQMALPLGFSVQGGVKIGFGAKYSTMAKISRCTTQGCLVEGVCPPGMVEALLKEKTGKVTIRMMQGNTADLPVSLDGFGAAYQAMLANAG